MNNESGQGETRYQKVCTWCGVIIRRSDSKSSRGMCLKCFARMLSDHQRSNAQPSKTYKHSER